MPTISHQVLVSLFRECPALVLHLFELAAKRPLPSGVTARLHAAQVTDLKPPEYSADAVYLVEGEESVEDAFVVEVQLTPSETKHASWLQYVATLHRSLRVPVTVLVFALTDDMARWCEAPHSYDRVGNTFRPWVIGPRNIPRITDFEQARAFPELAVLSVAAHGHEPGAEAIAIPAWRASLYLDNQPATRYADFITVWLNESARRALEEYMATQGYEFQSEFARKYAKEGEQKLLVKQLGLKFGELPAQVMQRLRVATDADLERWAERVLTALTLDDVFAD
jgi:hypothetical protein